MPGAGARSRPGARLDLVRAIKRILPALPILTRRHRRRQAEAAQIGVQPQQPTRWHGRRAINATGPGEIDLRRPQGLLEIMRRQPDAALRRPLPTRGRRLCGGRGVTQDWWFVKNVSFETTRIKGPP